MMKQAVLKSGCTGKPEDYVQLLLNSSLSRLIIRRGVLTRTGSQIKLNVQSKLFLFLFFFFFF